MTRRMVRPQSATIKVGVDEPGTGVRIMVEVSNEAREKLAMMQMRRRRQGRPARITDLALDAIEQFLKAEEK